MTFLRALTTDDATEYFNMEKILNITPHGNGTTKILMGAGLHWRVYTDSIEFVDIENVINGGML